MQEQTGEAIANWLMRVLEKRNRWYGNSAKKRGPKSFSILPAARRMCRYRALCTYGLAMALRGHA